MAGTVEAIAGVLKAVADIVTACSEAHHRDLAYFDASAQQEIKAVLPNLQEKYSTLGHLISKIRNWDKLSPLLSPFSNFRLYLATVKTTVKALTANPPTTPDGSATILKRLKEHSHIITEAIQILSKHLKEPLSRKKASHLVALFDKAANYTYSSQQPDDGIQLEDECLSVLWILHKELLTNETTKQVVDEVSVKEFVASHEKEIQTEEEPNKEQKAV